MNKLINLKINWDEKSIRYNNKSSNTVGHQFSGDKIMRISFDKGDMFSGKNRSFEYREEMTLKTECNYIEIWRI